MIFPLKSVYKCANISIHVHFYKQNLDHENCYCKQDKMTKRFKKNLRGKKEKKLDLKNKASGETAGLYRSKMEN